MRIKMLTILVVIMIILMNIKVFANTTIPEPPKISPYHEYWILYDYGGKFYFIESSNPIKVTTDGEQLVAESFRHWVYRGEIVGWEWTLLTGEKRYYGFGNILKSNHDIYYEDGSDIFFFMNPREANRLHRVVRKVDFGTFLRIFLVGLPPVIGLIVLLIALRKAWQFLQNQFKGC